MTLAKCASLGTADPIMRFMFSVSSTATISCVSARDHTTKIHHDNICTENAVGIGQRALKNNTGTAEIRVILGQRPEVAPDTLRVLSGRGDKRPKACVFTQCSLGLMATL